MGEILRLDKLLANMGRGSRKEVHAQIKRGQVTINGLAATKVDQRIDPEKDVVLLDGQPVAYEKYLYLMMHKPAGYVSANEDPRDPVVMSLLPFPYCNMELFVAGRLDKDTEGLLILTNNGIFAHNMLSPKKHVPKVYFAQIKGQVTEDDIRKFAGGICLDDGYLCQPAQLTILQSGTRSEIRLTLHEGKFHQVKRMFQATGKTVTYLKRIQIGQLPLDPDLSPGQIKKLNRQELQQIGADLGER